jgi:hypothetical protein
MLNYYLIYIYIYMETNEYTLLVVIANTIMIPLLNYLINSRCINIKCCCIECTRELIDEQHIQK